MLTLLQPRDREDEFLERVAQLVDAQFEERTRAYADGHADGWILGYEAGLRALLAEAETALGRAG